MTSSMATLRALKDTSTMRGKLTSPLWAAMKLCESLRRELHILRRGHGHQRRVGRRRFDEACKGCWIKRLTGLQLHLTQGGQGGRGIDQRREAGRGEFDAGGVGHRPSAPQG